MILHENGEQVQYLNKEMKEEMCLIDKYPSELKKKVSLITYFRKYMNDHLLKVSKKDFRIDLSIRFESSSLFRREQRVLQKKVILWPVFPVYEHGSEPDQRFVSGYRMGQFK